MKSKLFTLFIFIFILLNGVEAQNPYLTFTLFSNGKLDSITALVNAGDSRMFVVEQQGYIRILDSAGNVMSKPFLDIADEVGTAGNEEGLLGLAFSPGYKTPFEVLQGALPDKTRFRDVIMQAQKTRVEQNHKDYCEKCMF